MSELVDMLSTKDRRDLYAAVNQYRQERGTCRKGHWEISECTNINGFCLTYSAPHSRAQFGYMGGVFEVWTYCYVTKRFLKAVAKAVARSYEDVDITPVIAAESRTELTELGY